jgi:hypothetical protein
MYLLDLCALWSSAILVFFIGLHFKVSHTVKLCFFIFFTSRLLHLQAVYPDFGFPNCATTQALRGILHFSSFAHADFVGRLVVVASGSFIVICIKFICGNCFNGQFIILLLHISLQNYHSFAALLK